MDYEKGVIMIKMIGRYELISEMNSQSKTLGRERLNLNLEIIDGNGLVVRREDINVYLTKKSASDEDDPPYWKLNKRLFFYNPKRRSLKFRLSIPERTELLEQEWIDFDLRDRIVSMRPLNIRRID
jgi:hypothetical protein